MPVSEKIKMQIEPDGVMTTEKTRQLERHYEYFNLKAYIYIALLRKNRTGYDRDWSDSSPEKFTGLNPVFNLISMDIKNNFGVRSLRDDDTFDNCRYLEIFRPAAIAFNANDYNEASELLRSNGCSNPDINLVFPPITLVEF